MGNSSGRKTFYVPENQKIFDLLNDMHTKERLFKTFCAKFEYKIYKKPLDEKKFEITWEDFNLEMLNNFSDFEENYVSYILLETLRNYFKYHNNSLRIFNGVIQGGAQIARADLTNVSNSAFLAKATAAGVGGGVGGDFEFTVAADDSTSRTISSGKRLTWMYQM
jgi:hypothetical protein